MRPNYFREALEKIGKERDDAGSYILLTNQETEREMLEDIRYDVKITKEDW